MPPTPDAPAPDKLIAYYRVSTAKQGESGLGLAGQKTAVEAYARNLPARIVFSYTEVESGKRNDRPEFEKAKADAVLSGARLVIAKLDRLARNVHFISGLMEDKQLDFVACDNPYANPLTIHILAAVAEDEAKRISERTKAGLAAYRDLGKVSKRIKLLHPDGVPPEVVAATAGKLGATLPQCRNLTTESQAKGTVAAAEARSKRADKRASLLLIFIQAYIKDGCSLRQVADRLNARQTQTPSGKTPGEAGGAQWTHVQVRRVLDRSGPPPSQSQANA